MNMTISGKVQPYMVIGKPVIGAINGSCANFIRNNEIGYSCNSEESEALAILIRELDITKLQEIGKYSREVYFRKYSKSIFINRLIDKIKLLSESK